MPTLATLVASKTRTPTATVRLGGQICRVIVSLKVSQAFGSGISTATIVLRDPPITPAIGTAVSIRWGYNGQEVSGFTGEIARPARKSYPNRYTLECRDALWRASRSNQVIATDPLNNITASAAIRYILTHYGGISSSKISLPTFTASGSKWGGSEWTLGIDTPVQWGDSDTDSGGTTALDAAQEICSVLGYWLYADASGIIRAKQMERAPSLSAVHTFQRGVDLLTDGSPELTEDVDAVRNRIIVKGGNTGIDGAQIMDSFQTSHPVLPAGIYQEDTFSSFLIEYVNASEAGAASATEVAKRILKARSRLPVVVRHRVKADPRLSVGATVGITDSGVGLTNRNFFIYELETSLDAQSGNFSQQMTLDGGTGNSGYTTIPPPDASFTWRLVAETADGDAIVEVFLDGSGSASLSGGLIVDWDWSTTTTTYDSSPDTATGVTVTFIFLQSELTADITLTVTDTTSKTGTITQTIDLTGADTQPPISRVLGVAFGAAWAITPDGGATWNVETSNGDAIAVGTVGAGADDRASSTVAGTYGMVATRGSGGAGGLRRSLDTLSTASTNLVSNAGAVTSNIWQNEANPARVWFAIGAVLYRSLDGGATKTAMASAPATIHWVQEDASVDNSVFILAGADMLNATDPTIGYALLYAGPLGATARQFVRSRDGQVTWICYTGAPSGEALQRVETGALADIAVTDIRTLALDNAATGLSATLYAITADDPAQIWSFDGLTGLSATQATPTLPAGATAMHMLADPDVDLFYIADFDSVASGTGAVRKFLADQLLLYKAGATGQQAHMLGFGARVSAPAEFLLMTVAVDPAGVWHYRDGVWTFRPLPVSGTAFGVGIVADTFNPDRWLAVFNNTSTACFSSGGKIIGHDWGYSPLWETENAGVTWTEVIVAPPGGWVDGSFLNRGTFNDQVGNSWAVTFASGGSFYTAAVFGSGAVVTSITEGSTTSAPMITGGADAEWLVVVTNSAAADGLRYIDTTNIFHTPAGSSPGDLQYASLDRAPGTSLRAYTVDGTNLLSTSDYRTAQPTTLLGTVSAIAVAVGSAALYYLQADGDLFRVTDPTGAATTTQLAFANAKTSPRVDRQTRTTGGALLGGAILVDDGTTSTTLAIPADPGFISNIADGALWAFEIMVRQ